MELEEIGLHWIQLLMMEVSSDLLWKQHSNKTPCSIKGEGFFDQMCDNISKGLQFIKLFQQEYEVKNINCETP